MTRRLTERGYVVLRVPGHPRARRGRVFEHVLVVEAAMGKHLPLPAVVHHIDTDKTNNANNNLVACHDQAYHLLLHRRMRALEACGNPDAVQCYYCRSWAKPEDMDGGQRQRHHRSCARDWQQQRRDEARGGRAKHLDLVAARPTCKHGHPWTEETTRINTKGARWCLACSRASAVRRVEALKGKRGAA